MPKSITLILYKNIICQRIMTSYQPWNCIPKTYEKVKKISKNSLTKIHTIESVLISHSLNIGFNNCWQLFKKTNSFNSVEAKKKFYQINTECISHLSLTTKTDPFSIFNPILGQNLQCPRAKPIIAKLLRSYYKEFLQPASPPFPPFSSLFLSPSQVFSKRF